VAYLTDEMCIKCGHVTPHTNHKCSNCSEKETRLAKARWDALTDSEKIEELKERIDRIERDHTPTVYYK